MDLKQYSKKDWIKCDKLITIKWQDNYDCNNDFITWNIVVNVDGLHQEASGLRKLHIYLDQLCIVTVFTENILINLCF